MSADLPRPPLPPPPPPPDWPLALPPVPLVLPRPPPHSARVVWALGAVLVVVSLLFVASFVYFDHPIPGSNCNDWYVYCPLGPSDFAPVGIERATPGSIGCAAPVGAVCYRADYAPSIPGLTLSGLRFNVANPSNQTINPNAPTIPLGPTATVSALGSDGQVVGVWSMQSMMWQNGAGAPVPPSSDTAVILDTGLLSNATLSGAYLYIILSGTNQAVGFPLFCAEC